MSTFVKKHLHGGPPESIDTDALQQRVRELEEQNKKLENELTLVKQQVRFKMCLSIECILVIARVMCRNTSSGAGLPVDVWIIISRFTFVDFANNFTVHPRRK